MEIRKCNTINELIDHYQIRKKVFIEEQQVSYEDEFDLEEKNRTAFVIYENNIPIGAGRINFLDGFAKIERVCVLKEYRGSSIGKKFMEYLIQYCKEKKVKEIRLGAQTTALGFYEKLGFIKYGEEFLDANIPHFMMKLTIK